MPLDPDVAEWLARLAALPELDATQLTPEQTRANYLAAPKPDGDPIARVEDAVVPGPDGPIPVRLYADHHDTGVGTVAFFHGGGWVVSSIDGHDSLCRRLAKLTGALIVSVEYRLAPEDPFPAGHDDCWAVTKWLSQHAADFGGDPSRLAVAGDSAGGNLAATVAIRARDEGVPLALQLLMYPCIDVDYTRPSYSENAQGYFLTAPGMIWYWDQYVPAEHRSNPYAIPMAATDLTGVAPALVQTAAYDVLRDEGEAYAARLTEAGVPAALVRYPGVVHGFISRWVQCGRAHEAHADAASALKTALGINRSATRSAPITIAGAVQ